MSKSETAVSTETATIALHYLHCDRMNADETIQCCQGLLTSDESAFGLLYSSDKCRLIRLTSKELLADQSSDINLQSVFELRVFNESFELRWLHEQSGNGRSVIVSESQLAKVSIGDWTSEFVTDVGPQTTHGYQLWGKALSESEASGWTILTDAQIGELRIPLAGVAKDQRVALTAVEYLGVGDDDGNMIVVEERLTGLKVLPARAIARRIRVWSNHCNVIRIVKRGVLFSRFLTKERRDADGACWYCLQTL